MTVPIALLALLIPLVLLATHRVTRFITRDKLPLICVPREKFIQRWGTFVDNVGDQRKISINGKKTNIFMSSLAYAWECDWCTSVWVGSGLTYLTWRWSDVMIWVLTALAASSATGLIALREPD